MKLGEARLQTKTCFHLAVPSIKIFSNRLNGANQTKGQIMHASYVELKVKPDQLAAMKNYTNSIEEKIKRWE